MMSIDSLIWLQASIFCQAPVHTIPFSASTSRGSRLQLVTRHNHWSRLSTSCLTNSLANYRDNDTPTSTSTSRNVYVLWVPWVLALPPGLSISISSLSICFSRPTIPTPLQPVIPMIMLSTALHANYNQYLIAMALVPISSGLVTMHENARLLIWSDRLQPIVVPCPM